MSSHREVTVTQRPRNITPHHVPPRFDGGPVTAVELVVHYLSACLPLLASAARPCYSLLPAASAAALLLVHPSSALWAFLPCPSLGRLESFEPRPRGAFDDASVVIFHNIHLAHTVTQRRAYTSVAPAPIIIVLPTLPPSRAGSFVVRPPLIGQSTFKHVRALLRPFDEHSYARRCFPRELCSENTSLPCTSNRALLL
jgi:hypothetical protein